MNTTTIARALSATAAIALLAGCAAGGTQVAPPAVGSAKLAQSVAPITDAAMNALNNTIPKQFRKARTTQLLDRSLESYRAPNPLPAQLAYVSDVNANFINVYQQSNAAYLYTINFSGGLVSPYGLFVDHAQNLWVANLADQNVLVFPRGSTTPDAARTLQDPAGYPIDVTICQDGTAYVSNASDIGSSGGSIQVYPPGNTTPARTLHYPGQGTNYFLTCMPNGDIFTDIFINPNTNVGRIVRYPNGHNPGRTLLPPTLQWPGGIKPDNAGNIVVVDEVGQTVTEYTTAGLPTANPPITTPQSNWVDIAIRRNSGDVLGANEGITSEGDRRTLWAGGTLPSYTSPQFVSPTGAAFDPGQPNLG